jgi:hypothetical protein
MLDHDEPNWSLPDNFQYNARPTYLIHIWWEFVLKHAYTQEQTPDITIMPLFLALLNECNIYFRYSLFLCQISPLKSCLQWHSDGFLFGPVSIELLVNLGHVHFS